MHNSLKYIYMVFILCLFIVVCAATAPQVSFAISLQQKVHLLLVKAEAYSKQKGKHDIALKMCNDAVRLQPKNLEAYYIRGLVCGRRGDYLSAIKNFSIVITHDEKNKLLKYRKARKWRADCFMGIGLMQNAVDDYSVLLIRSPKSSKSGKIWFYMAEALALMNKNDLALNAIRKGCATGSHWCVKMESLQDKILKGTKIIPHKPLSN